MAAIIRPICALQPASFYGRYNRFSLAEGTHTMPWFNRNKKPVRITALHIDDSKWVRVPVAIMLRRQFGMRVLEAGNGLDGIAIAEKELPDVILLDVMMPD